MDLKDLIKKDSDFEFKSETYGDLVAFPLTGIDQENIGKNFGVSTGIIDASEYVKALASVVCHPKSKLIEGKFKPKEYSLPFGKDLQFSAVELDIFASLFLEHNKYLYLRDKISPGIPNNGGNSVTVEINGELKYPKIDKETDVSYLHRLFVLEEKRSMALAEKAMGFAFQREFLKHRNNYLGFSPKTLGQIDKTLFLGSSLSMALADLHVDSIHKSAAKMAAASMDATNRTAASIAATSKFDHYVDLPRNLPSLENTHTLYMRTISTQMNDLITSSKATSEFLVQMNITQTDIAKELKESSSQAKYYSKLNYRINLFIVVLTAISIALSSYAFINSIRNAKSENSTIKNAATVLGTKLDALNISTQENVATQKEIVKELKKKNK
jgi:hypothetical protein